MKTKKLFKYKRKFYKYLKRLTNSEKTEALIIYEKTIKIIRKLKDYEIKGKIIIKPSAYELENNFIKEKKQISGNMK